MKTFDEALEEAFEAGRAHERDVQLTEEGRFAVYNMAPDFTAWRARLGDPDQ